MGTKRITLSDGFTLIEVIISIAVLSIICVIFLRLFVTSGDMIDRSKELDRAVIITNSVIEQMKGIHRWEDMKESTYFEKASFQEEQILFYLNSSFDYVTSPSMYRLEVLYTEEAESDLGSALYQVTLQLNNEETEESIYGIRTAIIIDATEQ